MQVANKISLGRTELLAGRVGLQQQPCRPRGRVSVIAAAAQKDEITPLPQRLAAATAAALLITQAQPAFANPPTLYAREGKYAEELAELVAKRKALPDLKDVPDVKEGAAQITKDVPLDKIAGKVKQSTVDALPSIPDPLPAPKDAPKVEIPKFTPPAPQPQPAKPAATQPAAPQPAAPKLVPKAAAPAAAPSAPAPAPAPAPAAGGAPNSGVLLGVGAVVVLGGAAALASGKNGETADVGAAVQSAEKKVEQTADDAVAAAKANAAEAREWIDAWRKKTGAGNGSNSSAPAEPAAADAAAAAEINAQDARKWIENWRNKSN